MNKGILVLFFVIVGALGFFGGLKYGQTPKALAKLSSSKLMQVFAANRGNRENDNSGRFAARAAGSNGNFVNGQILSQDDKSLTIKMADKSTKIVIFSDSTRVGKVADGSKSDLTTGEQVLVNGTANSDGSLTAQSIQIRPN